MPQDFANLARANTRHKGKPGQGSTRRSANKTSKKRPNNRRSTQSSQAILAMPRLWLMGLGATLLFAALLIYLAMILPLAQQKSQLPQSIPWYHGGTGATANGQSSVRPVVKKPAVKKTAPKATTKAEETKVRFEFYNILPKSEVIIPQPKTIGPKAKPVVKTPLPIATGNNANQLLQVGSFRSAADADRLRARLALLGLNPKINSVQIDGQQTWHRVQLGPFANQQQLADTQAILSLAKVNSLLIRQP